MILVSVFQGYRNPYPRGSVDLPEWLFSSACRSRVEAIRRTEDKSLRRAMKSRLPCITPSGLFRERNNRGLIRHSGLLCVDIDGADNPEIEAWHPVKERLSDLPGLYYAGLSTGGEGLFLLIRIGNPLRHGAYFDSVVRELGRRGLRADLQCRDVSRLRGASWDPAPLFTPGTACYPEPEEEPIHFLSPGGTTGPFCRSPEITRYRVSRLVDRIDREGINVADSYRDWFRVGCALASEFGEGGREYFHRVSRNSEKYRREECDRQYDACLRCGTRYTISTFFYLCREHGLTLKSE